VGTALAVDPGTRVLIAEDNPENVILLRAYLENLPVCLHFASNGLEAASKRRSDHYDLVLMDVQMPVMDGYTATREIREWERASGKPRIPIVALTAHALSGASAESIASGCDAHITKPVERADLIAAISRFAKREPHRPPPVTAAIAARRPAFLENRRADLSKMKDALKTRDFAVIQHIAHDCKGIGAGYGFPEIGRIGANLECAARALDGPEMERFIGEFEQSIQCAEHPSVAD
jgi:CheY-like chemotaxis protein